MSSTLTVAEILVSLCSVSFLFPHWFPCSHWQWSFRSCHRLVDLCYGWLCRSIVNCSRISVNFVASFYTNPFAR